MEDVKKSEIEEISRKFDETVQRTIKEQKEAVAVRREYNMKILDFIKDKVNQFPELRFCQILRILDLDRDRFYEESKKTYETLHVRQ